MAITDGTAGSGLPVGTRTFIGDRPITIGDVARLDDGTIAGSTLTMDQAFRNLVRELRMSHPRCGALLRDHSGRRPRPGRGGAGLRGLDRGPDRS